MKISTLILFFFLMTISIPKFFAQQCGVQGGGRACPTGHCCSIWGWCGDTDAYCSPGYCQSQCDYLMIHRNGIGDQVISKEAFERMMPNTGGVVGFEGFYEAFITAAKSFPSFGNVGTIQTRKREVAAFLAQTLHVIFAGNDRMSKKDAINYFKTGILLWMTPQSSKPSHHQLMIVHRNSTSSDSARVNR